MATEDKGFKYDIGDTVEYQLEGAQKPIKAKIFGRRVSEHPDRPGEHFDHEYEFDATHYLGDSEDRHVVSEEAVLGRVK